MDPARLDNEEIDSKTTRQKHELKTKLGKGFAGVQVLGLVRMKRKIGRGGEERYDTGYKRKRRG